MDQLKLRHDPPDELQGALIFRVLVNGQIVPDEHYCLNVDSFFRAIGNSQSRVIFVGDCGVPKCCGDSYLTLVNERVWCWSREPKILFEFSWPDIYGAASKIIEELDRMDVADFEVGVFSDRLPFYREVLTELKTLANK